MVWINIIIMDMCKFEGENKRFLKINFHGSFVNVSFFFFFFRILAPNSNFQDVETLYNFLVKYEVWKKCLYIIHIIFILFEYKYNKIAIGIFFKWNFFWCRIFLFYTDCPKLKLESVIKNLPMTFVFLFKKNVYI